MSNNHLTESPSKSSKPISVDTWFLSLAVILWAMLFLCRDVAALSLYVLPSGQWLWLVFQTAFIALNGATLAYPYVVGKLLDKHKLNRKRLPLLTLAYCFISLVVNGVLYYALYYYFCPTCYFG